MGADLKESKTRQPKPETKKTLLFVWAGVLILIICALKWSDVIEYFNGEPRLSSKHQNQLQKKLDELDEAEQYALVAISNGWYPCLHGGRSLYYLKANEVWKYGVTTKCERGRYTSEFLQDNEVLYIIQFKGILSECLQEEQRKLFSYPILPENLSRLEVDRLLRPPYNPVLK